jgi:NAD(P)-dependent dehydrogenase (short-subunit alcohol dehydrogenase family)
MKEEMLAGFSTNVVGTVHLFSLFLPLILQGRHKKVIYMSSAFADLDLITKYGMEASGPYIVEKAAGNMVVAKYHAEYAKDGVLFMSVAPGVVDTGHLDPSTCRLLILLD